MERNKNISENNRIHYANINFLLWIYNYKVNTCLPNKDIMLG